MIKVAMRGLQDRAKAIMSFCKATDFAGLKLIS